MLTLLSFPLLARALSTADFGVLDLILTGGTLLGYFVGCGLNNAVNRYYWDDKTSNNQRSIIVSNGLGVQIVLGVCISLIIIVVSPVLLNHTDHLQLQNLTYITLLGVAIMIPTQQWLQYIRDVLRLHFAPWRFTLLSFLSKILAIGLGLYAVFALHKNIEGFILAQAIACIIMLPIGFYMIRQDIHLKLSWSWIKRLTRFGSPFIYVGVAYWIFGYIDRWMLASLSSIDQTGIYSMATRFSSIALMASIAFGQAWSPNAVKIKTDNPETYKDTYATVLMILMACMLVVSGTLAIFAPEIVALTLPESYSPAATPMTILCFSIIFQATQQITAIGISLENRTKIFGYLTWATAILNIFLNFLLIPLWGATGAAIATALSQFSLTLAYAYFTRRLHQLSFFSTRLLPLLGIGSLFGITVSYLSEPDLHFTALMLKLGIIIILAFLTAMVFLKDIVTYATKK